MLIVVDEKGSFFARKGYKVNILSNISLCYRMSLTFCSNEFFEHTVAFI